MLKSTAVAAGALIAGGGGAVAATLASEPALERVVIDCGFKGGPAHHAHGRGVRDRLHDVVLEAVASAAPRGHRAQLRAAEEAFERAVAGADPARISELWLMVGGHIAGRYHERRFTAATAG